MFSHSTNLTVSGGKFFHVYYPGATVGTSEVVEGGRYLMAVT